MREATRWFFDTVVLSNFALVGRLDIISKRYGKKAHVTAEVLAEISDGVAAGYSQLRDVEDIVGSTVALAKSMSTEERRQYRELLDGLSSGQASCIACAQSRGGIVVTDDRAARGHCAEHRLTCTGTIGILKACCVDGSLTPGDADDTLSEMVEAGFYAPVRRISDLL